MTSRALLVAAVATVTLTGCGTAATTSPTIAAAPATTTTATATPAVTITAVTEPAMATTTAVRLSPPSDRYHLPIFAAAGVSTATYATDLADLVTGLPVAVQLDVYEPAGDTATERPVIVWIHGGGFRGGSRTTLVDVATAYARLGYVTVSIDYRLDPTNRCQDVQDGRITDPAQLAAEAERCRVAIQTAEDDSALAIAWLRARAATYRIDPTRIAVGGFSAGAITAVHLAQRQNSAGPAPAESVVSLALAASGCNLAPDTIDSSDAPVSIVASGGDQLVPFACSVTTADRTEAAGVAVQRLFYPDEDGHAKVLYGSHQTEVDTAWQAFLVTYLQLA